MKDIEKKRGNERGREIIEMAAILADPAFKPYFLLVIVFFRGEVFLRLLPQLSLVASFIIFQSIFLTVPSS